MIIRAFRHYKTIINTSLIYPFTDNAWMLFPIHFVVKQDFINTHILSQHKVGLVDLRPAVREMRYLKQYFD